MASKKPTLAEVAVLHSVEHPAPTTPDERKMEQIRDILFGGLSREYDRRFQEMGERIFRLVLATASGEATKSERHGYGQNEFVPWQVGAVIGPG